MILEKQIKQLLIYSFVFLGLTPFLLKRVFLGFKPFLTKRVWGYLVPLSIKNLTASLVKTVR